MTRTAPRITFRLLLAVGLAASVLTVLAPVRDAVAQGDPRTEMDEVIDVGEGESRRTLSVFQCDRLLERLGQEIPALAA